MKLRLLSEGDSQDIYRAALQILQEMGMQVMDQDTRKMLLEAGCQERQDGYLCFDEQQIPPNLLRKVDWFLIIRNLHHKMIHAWLQHNLPEISLILFHRSCKPPGSKEYYPPNSVCRRKKNKKNSSLNMWSTTARPKRLDWIRAISSDSSIITP